MQKSIQPNTQQAYEPILLNWMHMVLRSGEDLQLKITYNRQSSKLVSDELVKEKNEHNTWVEKQAKMFLQKKSKKQPYKKFVNHLIDETKVADPLDPVITIPLKETLISLKYKIINELEKPGPNKFNLENSLKQDNNASIIHIYNEIKKVIYKKDKKKEFKHQFYVCLDIIDRSLTDLGHTMLFF